MSALVPLTLPDAEGLHEIFVAAENPGRFEQAMIAARPQNPIADLAKTLLCGQGTLIDVGANIGTVCVPVSKSGSNVLAIEMLPENCLRLFLAVQKNKLKGMHVLQCAATSSIGLASYAGEEAWAQVQENSEKKAVGLTLDAIIELYESAEPLFIRHPLVIKIDVESHELEVLKGAARTIESFHPFIIFESVEAANLEPHQTRQVKRTLCSYGYRLFIIRNNILAPREPDDFQESLVSDFLAVPSYGFPPAEYEVRPLTPAERLAWLKEIADHSDLHRLHAESLMAIWSSDSIMQHHIQLALGQAETD